MTGNLRATPCGECPGHWAGFGELWQQWLLPLDLAKLSYVQEACEDCHEMWGGIAYKTRSPYDIQGEKRQGDSMTDCLPIRRMGVRQAGRLV
jgi:hypothetical protein